ncbi:MAG: KTSC domain-containing protein [Mesorhizobium sp.]|nr:KTSC domain-containing protein [Mesorhizobium sp. M5C.F.Ca.IN.020.32.2.1]RUV76011.1 KTSC domain-containing protein [Mesorhizobium sp. M5C.F.Cr.IN.023.01.1.1]RUV96211.1 KTSC domain-containing protein [Mesorhizobium sp. M5C.F.Ca.IN.020.14.1.1]RWB27554.1 MAG: KTSC domain-containing protein [Mesorhizobium sp.]TGT92492.1 KTSC domain-containing protein [Mesorhizobium sp. M5C.F.Ca.ET.164.01.1.1]
MVDCVPPETFAAFKAAFAKGRYFNDHIRNHFRYRVAPTNGDLVVARVRNRQSSLTTARSLTNDHQPPKRA